MNIIKEIKRELAISGANELAIYWRAEDATDAEVTEYVTSHDDELTTRAEALLAKIGRRLLASRLSKLTRHTHNVCDDGDGHIDDWSSADPEGEYVLWEDIKSLIKELKTGGTK